MLPKKNAVADVNSKKSLKQGTLFSFFSKKCTTTEAPPQPSQTSSVAASSSDVSHGPNKDFCERTIEKPNVDTSDSLSSHLQIGDMIEVYWLEDDAWYQAKVMKIKSQNPKHFIEYFIDGQSEWIDLSTESFRLLDSNAGSNRKRRCSNLSDEDDFGEEAEFFMPPSDDEGSTYNDEGNDENEEDDDDQWMVTDDEEEDEMAPHKRRKTTARVIKPSEPKKKKMLCSRVNSGSSSSSTLREFSAGSVPISLSERSSLISGTTPVPMRINSSQQMTTPPQITPGTTASATHLSSNSVMSANRMIDRSGVATPLATQKTSSKFMGNTSKPPMFEIGALNPAGSHVHNHLPFLQNPRDGAGRLPDDPQYDPRTLQIIERDWIRITGKGMTDAVKQWWDLKAMYFDTVLLFKTGKFYEMFHMDADIGVQVCGLCYMKGHCAHAGFPEISYGAMADKLVRAGYKVARVEQTETPEQLAIRKKSCRRGTPVPKVVNREVCSILTLGTRTFCYLDDESCLLGDENGIGASAIGPLLSIREICLTDEKIRDDHSLSQYHMKEGNEATDLVKPAFEYGITLIDAVRGSVTIGQFADDVLRSRLVTLLASFSPSEILLEGGDDGASKSLHTVLRSMQASSPERSFLIEIVKPTEVFPQSTAIDPTIRKQLGRSSQVHPWDALEALQELHRRGYYPQASKLHESDKEINVKRWPKVLRAAVEGKADLALSSFGAALFYLQRNLIDAELLSMGNVFAYVPPNTSIASSVDDEIQQLAEEQNVQDSGLNDLPSVIEDIIQDETPESGENEISFMALDGTTLHNLEILTNSVDYRVAGSLWSKINYTTTPHGSRLLRAWLLRPLFRKDHIERRLDAVEELVGGGAAMALTEARSILIKCGDIERLLSRVHSMSGIGVVSREDDDLTDRIHPNDRAVLYETATYTKRKVGDFSKVLCGLRYASQIPELFSGIEIRSGLLRKIVQYTDQGGCFPRMADDLDWFFRNFDLDQAAKGLFEPGQGIDDLYDEACATIDRILAELNEYRDEMCSNVLTPRTLAKSSWKFINTKIDSKDKYLIELPANMLVPDDFIMKGKRGNGPKQVNKYATPVVEQLVMEMERAFELQKERKAKGMELIFAKFDSMRSVWAAAAHATALLDALGSLAQTASKSEFSRPIILDCPLNSSPCITIQQGRHPCVEHTFNSTEFIPNDLSLGCDARVLLLSGPNMGGKSTLLRQTCLIAILAQLGSFVPAARCELTPIDRIYTRLGASDRILVNQSTFFVELAETAAALRGASRRSLVIMDELGRGTSTFDGTAIASATVQHLVERNKCLTLFATHYHSLLEEWKDNGNVKLGHMECLVENSSAPEVEESNITFLYTLGSGVCPKSFGINVARLAGLPDGVLIKAKRISAEFEVDMSSGSEKPAASSQKSRVLSAIQKSSWDEVVRIWESLQ